MSKKTKTPRDSKPENRDPKRDRAGWKAERAIARRKKGVRRAFEQGEKF